MKTTIELPDQLMIEVEAMAGRERREISEFIAEVLRVGLKIHANQVKQNEIQREVAAKQWLEDWIRLGDECSANAPAGPTARQLLDESRNRLERDACPS